jgi:peroxiredoxin
VFFKFYKRKENNSYPYMIKTLLVTAAILALAGAMALNAGEVTLTGNAPGYKGDKLTFYTYKDHITYQEQELGSGTVDSSGNFEIRFTIDHTAFVYSHLGQYKAYLYAEPGNNYRIILPGKSEKSKADELNPYFEEQAFHLGVDNLDEHQLNLYIVMFDDMFTPYMNKFAYDIYKKNTDEEINAAVTALTTPFESIKNEYFQNYMKYNLGMLKHLAYQMKSKKISNNYFLDKPVLYNNVAYMELFNQVYDRYFMFFSKTNEGKQLFKDINENKSYTDLKKTLGKDKVFSSDSLLELVILKNLYDEFYSDKFSRSALLEILEQLQENTKIAYHAEIAANIRDNITKLLAGYPPPAFELYNRDSVLHSLDDFKGKYVYLVFCNCVSYSCIKEYQMLKTLYAKHEEYLEIVTIAVEESFQLMKDFLERYNYKWPFLNYSNQPDVMTKYDIRAFPTYFLIDPEGKLVLSPAPSPGENFEMRLFKIMRERGDI